MSKSASDGECPVKMDGAATSGVNAGAAQSDYSRNGLASHPNRNNACPVDHASLAQQQPINSSLPQLSNNNNSCPVDHASFAQHVAVNSSLPQLLNNNNNNNNNAPADHPSNNMPVTPEQQPAPEQKMPLNTHRAVSSIPKGDFTPDHQKNAADGEGKVWVYVRLTSLMLVFF